MQKPPLVITEFAEQPEDRFLDLRALANALGVSPRTIRRMISRCEIPAGIRLGGKKVWNAGTVLQYLNDRSKDAARKSGHLSGKLDALL